MYWVTLTLYRWSLLGLWVKKFTCELTSSTNETNTSRFLSFLCTVFGNKSVPLWFRRHLWGCIHVYELKFVATLVGGGFLNGTAEMVALDGLVWTLPPFGICIGLSIGKTRCHRLNNNNKSMLAADFGFQVFKKFTERLKISVSPIGFLSWDWVYLDISKLYSLSLLLIMLSLAKMNEQEGLSFAIFYLQCIQEGIGQSLGKVFLHLRLETSHFFVREQYYAVSFSLDQ